MDRGSAPTGDYRLRSRRGLRGWAVRRTLRCVLLPSRSAARPDPDSGDDLGHDPRRAGRAVRRRRGWDKGPARSRPAPKSALSAPALLAGSVGLGRQPRGSQDDGRVREGLGRGSDLIKVRRVRGLLQSRLYPHLLCSLDRWGSDGNLVEVKTTGEFAKDWGEALTDEIPSDPMCQVQTQMAVTGAPGCHVFVLFAGQHFKRYFVPRNDEQIADIVAITADLWARIQSNDPPPIDGSDGAAAYLAQRFKTPTGATIQADETVQELAFSYLHISEEIKALTNAKAEAGNLLKAALGDATVAVGGDVKISWTMQAGSTYTVTKEPARVLRVSHTEA